MKNNRMSWIGAWLIVLGAGCGAANLAPPKNHRAEATACVVTSPGAPMACTMDSDCAGPGLPVGGRCVTKNGASACNWDQCLTDADCKATEVCSCAGTSFGWARSAIGNLCLAANCHADADCGTPGYCSPSAGACGNFYGAQGWYCHTPKDDCHDDSDCVSAGRAGSCAYDSASGRWGCNYQFCAG